MFSIMLPIFSLCYRFPRVSGYRHRLPVSGSFLKRCLLRCAMATELMDSLQPLNSFFSNSMMLRANSLNLVSTLWPSSVHKKQREQQGTEC